MKSAPAKSDALQRHLHAAATRGLTTSPTMFIEQGGALVDRAALTALRKLLPQLAQKLGGIRDSERLRRRLELLLRFFTELPSRGGEPAAPEREVGFVLNYFLKGFDVIPDMVPEIGLLDDALLVETVLRRHEAVLRGHWQERGRTWPDTW